MTVETPATHYDETWMAIPGYEGKYEASSLGRVRSLPRIATWADGSNPHPIKGRILKLKTQNQGYWMAPLTLNGKSKWMTVHRLVCAAFHGAPPDESSIVRHLDGDNQNNTPDNLRWGTMAENTQDMFLHGNAYWHNQTHCIHGHEFTPENTRVVLTKTGRQRNCRKCGAARSVPKNERRRRNRLDNRKTRVCVVCAKAFITTSPQAKLCSKECYAASRRVAFKRRRRDVA